MKKNLCKVLVFCGVLGVTAGLFNSYSLDLDAYNCHKTYWQANIETLKISLPIALRLANLPPETTFEQFRVEISARKAKARNDRDEALLVLKANPFTPDFILKNRLSIIELTLRSGFTDPMYGSQCGNGPYLGLLDKRA